MTPDNDGRINRDLAESMRKDPPPHQARGCSLRFLVLACCLIALLGCASPQTTGMAAQDLVQEVGALKMEVDGLRRVMIGLNNDFALIKEATISGSKVLTAGDEIGAGATKTQDTISDSQNKTSIEAESVRVSQRPTVAIVAITVALPLIFAFAIFATDRMLAYRQGLLIMQQAVADAGDGDLIAAIKPRVRAMGRRRKGIFDSVLREVR